jgi:hypothetical protein
MEEMELSILIIRFYLGFSELLFCSGIYLSGSGRFSSPGIINSSVAYSTPDRSCSSENIVNLRHYFAANIELSFLIIPNV